MTQDAEEKMGTGTIIQTNLPAQQVHPDLRRIVLTGFMGCGKSTLGRIMADRLGWTFFDLDECVEARTGLSVADVFALHGEAHFRHIESCALVSALGKRHTVIALGGGAPEVLKNRLLLEQTPGTLNIFLEAPFPVLFDRCVLQGISRPVLADPETAALRFARRQPFYRSLAHHTLAVANLQAEEAVESLMPVLAKPPKRVR